MDAQSFDTHIVVRSMAQVASGYNNNGQWVLLKIDATKPDGSPLQGDPELVTFDQGLPHGQPLHVRCKRREREGKRGKVYVSWTVENLDKDKATNGNGNGNGNGAGGYQGAGDLAMFEEKLRIAVGRIDAMEDELAELRRRLTGVETGGFVPREAEPAVVGGGGGDDDIPF